MRSVKIEYVFILWYFAFVVCIFITYEEYLFTVSQRKFAKVMFSQNNVCPWGGGLYPSMHWAGGVCPAGYLPRGPEADSPPQPDTMGYGQQADVTHPTGMHSCYTSFHQAILQGTKNGWSDKTHCTWIVSMIPSVVVRIFQYVDTDGNYMRTWKYFSISRFQNEVYSVTFQIDLTEAQTRRGVDRHC